MSTTPLCDAEAWIEDSEMGGCEVVTADFARDLERQLAAVTADLAASKERVARVVDISEGMAIELAAARDEIQRAIPAMRDYASKNPRWKGFRESALQDPNGVNAWLERNDAARSAEQQHKGE